VSRRFAVVVNECAAPGHPNPKAINLRDTENADQNFRFRPEKMAVGLSRELTEQEMDWLDTVVAIYAADLACQRGPGDLGWGRDIELHLAIRNPDSLAPHRVALQEIFADLTGDRLRVYFYQDEDPLPAPRYGEEWAPFDAVALFSGGVDSFVGAAKLLDRGVRPLLMSHGYGANTTPQRLARAVITDRYGPLPDTRISTQQVEGFPSAEDSQRARSLLFMGAAALVAVVQGVEDVYINENGVMAVHVPLTAARYGSLSTKTAYPPIIEKMGLVASRALGANVRIHNNLIADTKPEVVEAAKGLGVHHGLPDTASCWTWSRGRRHCGVCVPCLMRRISFELSGIEEKEPHRADPFDVEKDVARPFAHDNMAHLCQVVQEIETLGDSAIELEHPEILDGGGMITPPAARDLYRRWARQAASVLSAHPASRRFLQ
jgi:7-cyano-7-deazaguanine synthase in queuosine biosynthesis